MLKIY